MPSVVVIASTESSLGASGGRPDEPQQEPPQRRDAGRDGDDAAPLAPPRPGSAFVSPARGALSPSRRPDPVGAHLEAVRLRSELREAEARADLYHQLYREERDRRQEECERRLELELRLKALEDGAAVPGDAPWPTPGARNDVSRKTPPAAASSAAGCRGSSAVRRPLFVSTPDPRTEVPFDEGDVGVYDADTDDEGSKCAFNAKHHATNKAEDKAARGESATRNAAAGCAADKVDDVLEEGKRPNLKQKHGGKQAAADRGEAALAEPARDQDGGGSDMKREPMCASPNNLSRANTEGEGAMRDGARDMDMDKEIVVKEENWRRRAEPAEEEGAAGIASVSRKKDPRARDSRLAKDGTWFHMYKALQSCQTRDGNLRRAERRSKALKSWLQRQRAEYKKYQRGIKTSLTTDMIDALNDIGFELHLGAEMTCETKAASRWNKHMERLSQYHDMHGHLNIGQQDGILIQRAANAVQTQYAINVKKGMPSKHLTKERMDALSNMGYVFDRKAALAEQLQASWDSKLEELKKFKEAHGHTRVGRIACRPLYNFINYARVKYREGKLSDEQREALEALGVDLFPAKIPNASEADGNDSSQSGNSLASKRMDSTWDKRFQALVRFQKEQGHFQVPWTHSDKKLNSFVSTQRMHYRNWQKGKHSAQTDEQRAAMDKIGFPWDGRNRHEDYESQWAERYSALKAFQEEFGHCNVSFKQNKQLYRWVLSQRWRFQRWKAGNATANPMTDRQRDLLLGIGFDFEPAAKAWEKRLRPL